MKCCHSFIFYLADYKQWDIEKRAPIRANSNHLIYLNQNYRQQNGHNNSQPPPHLTSSTYVNDYKQYDQQQPVLIVKPNYNVKTVLRSPTNAVFDDRTGYKDAYVRHELPEKFVRSKEQYIKNSNSLDTLTTSRQDYTAKPIDKPAPFRPEQNRPTLFQNGTFHDQTTHKKDFKKWDLDNPLVVTAKRPGNTMWVPPTTQMSVDTSYNSDFIEKSVERRQKIRPVSRKRTQGKFDGNTTYNKDFLSYNNADSQRRPIKPNAELVRSDAPFDGSSSYRADYQPMNSPE